ncbi:Spy/CpxP family protein refolding chaperone [Escherichia coli]
MFDGISLTEHQRQQMRDLMQQARHEQPPVNVSELETIHRLVTAENFDENAVRAQAEKWRMSKLLVRLRWQKSATKCIALLTPEQQAVLNEKHQQRMEQLRDVTQWQKSSSLKLLSSGDFTFPVVNPVFLAIDTIPVFPHMMWGFFYQLLTCNQK